MRNRIALALLLIALPLGPLLAQDDGITAEDALDQAKRAYGPPAPRRSCKNEAKKEGEIVVCAEEEVDYSEYRVKSTAELDPNSREALDDGLPRAPDVAGEGIFQGEGISLGGKPVPVYMLDFSLLPETPEGSDADKVGKGEKAAD